MTIKQIALFTKPDQPEAISAAQVAQRYFEDHDIAVCTLVEALEGESVVDAALCFGGDGTLLHAARLLAHLKVPVCGVNFGRVGFLCCASSNNLQSVLDHLVTGSFSIDERAMICAEVYYRHEKVWEVDAVNEILIGGSNRTIRLELSINDSLIGEVVGDGLILATRTGSTAYARSAGGPVIMNEGLVLVPSNEITSNLLAPTVLPLAAEVTVVNQTQHAKPYVIADGQKDFAIEAGTKIKLRRSSDSLLLLDPSLVPPYARLTRQWAQPRP